MSRWKWPQNPCKKAYLFYFSNTYHERLLSFTGSHLEMGYSYVLKVWDDLLLQILDSPGHEKQIMTRPFL